jgi:hypothetical protein
MDVIAADSLLHIQAAHSYATVIDPIEQSGIPLLVDNTCIATLKGKTAQDLKLKTKL